jgi:hypothetical protein
MPKVMMGINNGQVRLYDVLVDKTQPSFVLLPFTITEGGQSGSP